MEDLKLMLLREALPIYSGDFVLDPCLPLFISLSLLYFIYLSPSLAFIRVSSQIFHPYDIKYTCSLPKK